MIVYYDSFCKICTSSSTIWKKLDWRNKLSFHSFRKLHHYPKDMEKQLYVQQADHWYKGYNALIEIAKLLPLIWVFLPFIYLFKWVGLGDFIYRKIANNRKLVPVNQCKNGDTCMISTKQK
ncbi:putative DCC family thiol-disulfide oxidoreductase YuxK [Virgibacillus natechei]|uniref:DCC family thiol-disulfide oxidoreductase YuxK n=1 Tax=Virgibacillus natechei TaxID=1216297 RepID=A0ABS4IBJ5_9BACI|nr:putative DCC family thiol-disulfide oxidoreductase YuxK [Virgibacillus natechei]